MFNFVNNLTSNKNRLYGTLFCIYKLLRYKINNQIYLFTKFNIIDIRKKKFLSKSLDMQNRMLRAYSLFSADIVISFSQLLINVLGTSSFQPSEVGTN